MAELNNPDRLGKAMVATSHQTLERGALLALDFPDPVAEARWIAHRILALRGMPFADERGKEPRGLTYSDCAVLLRSVRSNGAVITQALDAAGIPYVVGGWRACLSGRRWSPCVTVIRGLRVASTPMRASCP